MFAFARQRDAFFVWAYFIAYNLARGKYTILIYSLVYPVFGIKDTKMKRMHIFKDIQYKEKQENQLKTSKDKEKKENN